MTALARPQTSKAILFGALALVLFTAVAIAGGYLWNERNRPSQAKLRSTTHRRGNKTKPHLASSAVTTANTMPCLAAAAAFATVNYEKAGLEHPPSPRSGGKTRKEIPGLQDMGTRRISDSTPKFRDSEAAILGAATPQ